MEEIPYPCFVQFDALLLLHNYSRFGHFGRQQWFDEFFVVNLSTRWLNLYLKIKCAKNCYLACPLSSTKTFYQKQKCILIRTESNCCEFSLHIFFTLYISLQLFVPTEIRIKHTQCTPFLDPTIKNYNAQ